MAKKLVFLAALLLAATTWATTATRTDSLQLGGQASIKRYSETSTANAILAVTITPGHPFRIMGVYAKYSGSVTKNITVVLDNGAGAAYDATLSTIALSSAAAGLFEPVVERWYSADDVLVVTSEAGGGGVTCGLVIYLEVRR